MIGYLQGKIEFKKNKFVIVSVGGVGYKVYACPETIEKLGQEGNEATFFVYHHLRENTSDLYGFLTYQEQDFFEQLISVSGIGPKAALSIMMLAPAETLRQAIASGQKALLTKVSGIGQRTAERIILELKDKIFVPVGEIQKLSSDSEAVDALTSLGYSQSQARQALSQAPAEISNLEERIKQALKILAK